MSIIKCILGPQLYRIYKSNESPGSAYIPNTLEATGDRLMKWLNVIRSILWVAWPAIAIYFYMRACLNEEGIWFVVKFLSILLIGWIAARLSRGVGRWRNPSYLTFVAGWEQVVRYDDDQQRAKFLRLYDFDLHTFPVHMSFDESSFRYTCPGANLAISTQRSTSWSFKGILSYLAAHSFGIRMMYPGMVELLQRMLFPALAEGRQKLIEEHDGQRTRLESRLGHRIDAIFVDRRENAAFPNGKTLVITCEGNAAFLEVGLPFVALGAGYSVLGWNHPGFAQSTGRPYPDAERAAMEVVLQYAFSELGFLPQETMIYAWSTGGFTATYAGMRCPHLRGIILDAVFDDVLPLALNAMPNSLGDLTEHAIRRHLNLHNVDQLLHYPGPVLLVRRTQDESITTDRVDPLSNRGVHLLLALLRHRYPFIFDAETCNAVKAWVLCPSEQAYPCPDAKLLRSYAGKRYPLDIGDNFTAELRTQLGLYLAQQHMISFSSTHSVPLPSCMLKTPWSEAQLAEQDAA